MQKRQPTGKNFNGRLLEWMEICHERELQLALLKLDAHFTAWREGKLSPWELNREIHEFHDGTSRKLYNRYVGIGRSTRTLVLCGAIVAGLVDESELRPDIKEKIEPQIKRMRDN